MKGKVNLGAGRPTSRHRTARRHCILRRSPCHPAGWHGVPRPRRNRDDVRPRGHVALAAGIVAGSPDAAVGRESQDRDRGCAYPGCTATRFVEIHHLQHWEDGGGTDYDNLICLSPHHHDAHHAGVFTIAASQNAVIPFTIAARRGVCHPRDAARSRRPWSRPADRRGFLHSTTRRTRRLRLDHLPPQRHCIVGPARAESALTRLAAPVRRRRGTARVHDRVVHRCVAHRGVVHRGVGPSLSRASVSPSSNSPVGSKPSAR